MIQTRNSILSMLLLLAVCACTEQDRSDVDVDEVNVNILVEGEGKVAITPESDSTNTYLVGTRIEIEAIPDSNAHFGGWAGDVEGIGNPFSILLRDDVNLVASFLSGQFEFQGSLRYQIDPSESISMPLKNFQIFAFDHVNDREIFASAAITDDNGAFAFRGLSPTAKTFKVMHDSHVLKEVDVPVDGGNSNACGINCFETGLINIDSMLLSMDYLPLKVGNYWRYSFNQRSWHRNSWDYYEGIAIWTITNRTVTGSDTVYTAREILNGLRRYQLTECAPYTEEEVVVSVDNDTLWFDVWAKANGEIAIDYEPREQSCNGLDFGDGGLSRFYPSYLGDSFSYSVNKVENGFNFDSVIELTQKRGLSSYFTTTWRDNGSGSSLRLALDFFGQTTVD